MTLYSNEIKKFIATRDWPPGNRLRIEVDEVEDGLCLVIYRLNFNKFDGEDQLQIASQIKTVLETVNARGIPMKFQVVPGDVPNA